MKVLFFLLLVANLALTAYIQFGASSDNGSKLRPELQPEKIKLQSTPTACLEWEGYSCSNLQLAKAKISKRSQGRQRNLSYKFTLLSSLKEYLLFNWETL